ncbi:MAG: helix-turn-helix domain-containing protein [Methylophilaceae bacterium]|nr:helix-turn-helix domain-containing protein [Methylophilaceae bacterium]
MSEALPNLDPMLHQPVRTQIVAFLSARGEATFSELKRTLEITDGNLGAHLNKLVEAELLSTRDSQGESRLQTVFILTEGGRITFANYVAQLSKLLQITPEPQPLTPSTHLTRNI